MGFEAAREALDQAIPEQSNEPQTQTTDQAPEAAPKQTEAEAQPSVMDLEKLERFMYQGKEWTPKDLQSAIMRQADYTQKTQALSEERKYFDNLEHDLRAVRENPQLAEEFKRVYPDKFHSYLEYAAPNTQGQPQGPQGQPPGAATQFQLPPEVQAKLDSIDKLQKAWTEQEVEKTQAQLDAIFDRFGKKYELADERNVTALAIDLHRQGVKLDDAQWEKIFADDHKRHEQRYESRYQAKVKEWKETNKRAADAGPGGGTPGQAPKKLSFAEATEEAIKNLQAQRRD